MHRFGLHLHLRHNFITLGLLCACGTDHSLPHIMERIQLPLAPSGPSLAAHIAALDLLAARLDALPTRSRWPARIPINSKASFDGDIIHTDEIKVNIGGDWWIEMRATEAADYVRRRKAGESCAALPTLCVLMTSASPGTCPDDRGEGPRARGPCTSAPTGAEGLQDVADQV